MGLPGPEQTYNSIIIIIIKHASILLSVRAPQSDGQ